MDKYEFNIKVEQIKKLVNKGDYETAMKIADTIDWRRVRSTSLLTMIAQVYERNEEYQDAKDILLLAFERAPIGKGLLFKLTDLALREGNVPEAEAYYREFCDLSADDPRQNLLRYLILEAKGAPLEQQMHSLERYCQEELDEKWLYRLAELYQEAGRPEECVQICDKIMLMFGLGKYVDKAMELKLQYAPLTKYQMDLVENREKYEEKLRAVEEEYNNGTYRRETQDDEYYDEPSEEEMERDMDRGGEEAQYGASEPIEESVSDEDVTVGLHQAEAEAALAEEMSKLQPYDEEPDSIGGETRVFNNIRDINDYRTAEGRAEDEAAAGNEGETAAEDETVIEDWDLEPEETETNHLMIEAVDAAAGLDLALESLKKIHRELGTKNPVAKISGDKLNKKGVFAVADRLAGKDLVVEKAADLSEETVEELNGLMQRDETGMIVVLIDTPDRMERLHRQYPALAGMFQYIGCDRPRREAPEEARREPEKREEESRLQADRDAKEAGRYQAADGEEEWQIREEERARQERVRPAQYEEEDALREEEEAVRREEEARRQAEYEAERAAQLHAEQEAEEARLQAEYEEEQRRQAEYEEEQRRQAEEAHRQRQMSYESDEDYEAGEAEETGAPYGADPEDDHEMDVEEFAQYACKYASEIDCSISGKSMLALYERAEMMEEDGIPLTKTSAEDLIEEAADKAEKRSFGGLFSSKYDKDGLLILKEKHFFD